MFEVSGRALLIRCAWLFAGITTVLAVSPVPGWAQTGVSPVESQLPLMPWPASVVAGEGDFPVDGHFSVALSGYSEPRLVHAQARFLATLSRETGIPFLEGSAAQPSLRIHTTGPSQAVQQLGEDESYHLQVTGGGIELTAANPLGVLHGLQTILQLVQITPKGFAIPAVTIDDKPRFSWRGLMIDSGRHFIPIPVIERNLDGMEAVKLNVFHWHLSDDQGYRAESKVFPLLQLKGSDGLFYTQAEMRHIVEYAHERGIRVIPEFDMPAHATSWFVGYPQLASGPGPYQVEREWGVLNGAMDPTKESTYQFLNLFLGEMTALFPDAYFHIGGDECNGKEWDANPRIQEFKKAHHLADNAALQAMFTERLQKLVVAHHKIVEGWDEVLGPDTPKDVVIQSWRGRDSLLDAAKRGYRGLLSNGYYIDLNETAAEHYLVDPMEGIADKLTGEQAASILGGEATMWSEFVNGETMDSRIWPRTAAIAERFWSPAALRDVDSMYRRMGQVQMQFKFVGIDPEATTEAMLERLSGDPDPAALRVLAAVVSPPKGYAREDMQKNTSLSPLNHLVDAVPPESEVGHAFQGICQRIAAGKGTDKDWVQARQWMELWRDNDARLQPLLGRSALTQELVPVSQALHGAAVEGLEALQKLSDHQPVTADEQKRMLAAIADAEKPRAVLLVSVAPSIELLIQAVPVR